MSLLAFFYSCSSSKFDRTFETMYKQDFKMAYFKNCLKYRFHNNEIIILNELDGSGWYEPLIGTATYSFLDSLAFERNANRALQVERCLIIPKGNPIYEDCLCDYNSKWLDKLAVKKYKEE